MSLSRPALCHAAATHFLAILAISLSASVNAPRMKGRGGILLVPSSCQTALSSLEPMKAELPSACITTCALIESRSSPVRSNGSSGEKPSRSRSASIATTAA